MEGGEQRPRHIGNIHMTKLYLKHNPKVVALVGMGPSIVDILSETLTQECSPQWCDEVWAINMVSNAIQHDVVFWMDDLEQQQNFKPGLFDLLRRRGKPLITSVARRDIVPTSYDYPLDEIAAISVPVFGKPYLTNGVAMAIAYAMYKGVETLKIYGCDFTYPNRNFAEEGRACTEAWISLASVRGMNVALSPSTSLFDTVADHGIYGYAEQPEIVLPDGVKFKYTKKNSEPGRYVATDSSGVSNAVHSYLPRSPGTRFAPNERDDAYDQRRSAGEAEAAPVEGPGEGVADQDRYGCAEAPHPSGLNGGGVGRSVQESPSP